MFSRKPHSQFPYMNGSRGRYLLASGLIYLTVGLQFLPVIHGEYRARHFHWMWDLWKLEPGITVGPFWVLSGLMMCVAGFMRRPKDRFGFAAAWAAPFLTTFCYLMGFWFTRDPQAILAIAVYVFFSFMSITVSGMEGDSEREERLQWEREQEEKRRGHTEPATEGGD
jgi:hypothetical protein